MSGRSYLVVNVPESTTGIRLTTDGSVTRRGFRARIADFTGISTKNIYAKGVDVSALPKLEGVEGKDIRFLGIGANIKDALDEALEKGHGNLMIDCAVYIWSAPFVAGYKVRGSVIDIPYRKQPTTTQASGP